MPTSTNPGLGEDLTFHYAGREDCAPGHGWTSVRDHYLFHYVLSGCGVVRMGPVERGLRAGEGFLFSPGELSSYRADVREPWSYAWLGFSGEKALEAIGELGLAEGGRLYATERPGELGPRLIESVDALADGCGRLESMARLYRVLADLARFSSAPRDEAFEAAYSVVAAVMDYIRHNYSRHDMSIEAMAAKIGLSRKRLSALVREQAGKTPMALLMEHRMYAARELLNASDLPVSSVAASVGYSDQFAFSKAFRQWAGEPPRECRKRARTIN